MSTTDLKRSLTDATREALAFRGLFPPPCYSRWEIAGSIRRQRPSIGDCEHVVIAAQGEADGGDLFGTPQVVNLLWTRLDALEASGTVSRAVYTDCNGRDSNRWGDKYRGVLFNGVRHEIFTASEETWGPQLAIRTGPGDFSRMLVTRLANSGYKQLDGWVRDRRGGKVPCRTEENYFALCGVSYLQPHQRDGRFG